MSEWRELLPVDFMDLIEAFDKASACVLLIGGYAVSLQARPRFTQDIDFWIGTDPDNRERVVEALSSFGAPAEIVRALAEAHADEFVRWGHPPRRIDVLQRLEGMKSFNEAYQAGSAFADAPSVKVMSVSDLLEAKRLSIESPNRDEEKRLQDKADCLALERVLQAGSD